MEAASAERCGGAGAVGRADEDVVGIEEELVAGEGFAVEDLDVDEILGEAHDAVEEVVDDDGGEDEAPEGGFAFGGGGRSGAVEVDGDEVEEAGMFGGILEEGDAAGEGGFAGADGAEDGFAADGVAAGVEALGGAVDGEGIEEFGDVEVGGVAGSDDVEIGGVVGAFGGDEGVELRAGDAFDEAEAEDAGELGGELAGVDVGAEFETFDGLAGGVDAAGALEAVDGEVGAALDLAGEAFGEAVETVVGLRRVEAVRSGGGPEGEGEAGEQDGDDEKPRGQPGPREGAVEEGSGLHGWSGRRSRAQIIYTVRGLSRLQGSVRKVQQKDGSW